MAIPPTLLKEWDFKRNAELDPARLKPQSSKVVWWKCENGHRWKKRIQSRFLYKSGCPVCKSLGYLYPAPASEKTNQSTVQSNRQSFRILNYSLRFFTVIK
jgi:hypothetical protein